MCFALQCNVKLHFNAKSLNESQRHQGGGCSVPMYITALLDRMLVCLSQGGGGGGICGGIPATFYVRFHLLPNTCTRTFWWGEIGWIKIIICSV